MRVALGTVMTDYEIRIASEDDREDVIQLMSRIYPGDVAARYDWLYESNPCGRARTWLAIERATGEAVGCTSIFPRRVKVNGRDRMGSIGGDCFIEPRARRQGLATRLHKASFSEMPLYGIEFMYGPPTPNNLGALIKAGSRFVTNYKRWVRPLTSKGAYRAAFSRTPSKLESHIADIPLMVLDRLTRTNAKGFTLEEVHEFSSEFDQFFERAAASHAVVCSRDRSYMAWRYFSVPVRKQTPLAIRRGGEIVGFVALEQAGEYAAVADLFTSNDARLIDVILQLIVEQMAAAGSSSLEISLPQGCGVARRLRRHGFIGRDERGFQVALTGDQSQSEILLGADSWHFTEADQDLDTVFVSVAS
jgi:Acetyltransferase (GNAT) domain